MASLCVTYRHALLVSLLGLGLGVLSCGSGDDGGPGGAAVGRTCRVNTDCPGGEPFCNAGLCVECLSDASCDGGRTCDATAGKCLQPCTATAQCDGERLCAEARAVCVACLDDNDCSDAKKPRCVPELDACAQCSSSLDCDGRTCERGKCKECGSSADCPSDKPVCDVAESTCRECLTDAHCAPGEFCDGKECKEDCVLAPQVCGDGKLCDPSSSSCVSCLSDADCAPDKPGCIEHECRDCSRDEHCGAGQTCDAKKGKCG
jgi:Cys-rich repeat protein